MRGMVILSEEALTIVALMSVDSVLYYPHGEVGRKVCLEGIVR